MLESEELRRQIHGALKTEPLEVALDLATRSVLASYRELFDQLKELHRSITDVPDLEDFASPESRADFHRSQVLDAAESSFGSMLHMMVCLQGCLFLLGKVGVPNLPEVSMLDDEEIDRRVTMELQSISPERFEAIEDGLLAIVDRWYRITDESYKAHNRDDDQGTPRVIDLMRKAARAFPDDSADLAVAMKFLRGYE